MPKYRVIITETKSYSVEADNEESAMDKVGEPEIASRTLDFYEIKEVEDE